MASANKLSRTYLACAPCVVRARERRCVVAFFNSNELKNGITIDLEGDPWKVLEFQHVKPGKGAAFVRSKLKNLATGDTVGKTFRAGEPLTKADVEKVSCQYTYAEGNTYVFMNMETYDEVRIPKDDEWAQFLKEGTDCDIVFFGDRIISVDPPQNMVLKVIRADPAVKGNTSSGAKKPVTVETGAELEVPLFVEEGMEIRIDAQTGKYLGKA